jgi:hypothetical protein
VTDEQRKEFDELRQRVQELMNWDVEKATLWMNAENPMLGCMSPIEFIRRGRGHKVARFIASAEDENGPKPTEGGDE